MDLDRWRRVEQVLDRALASDPSGWPALVEAMCRDDAELRAEVEALLAQRSAAEDFLASPPKVATLALAEARLLDDSVASPNEVRNPHRPEREIRRDGEDPSLSSG
jgi:serine/threonine-protein kinase